MLSHKSYQLLIRAIAGVAWDHVYQYFKKERAMIRQTNIREGTSDRLDQRCFGSTWFTGAALVWRGYKSAACIRIIFLDTFNIFTV